MGEFNITDQIESEINNLLLLGECNEALDVISRIKNSLKSMEAVVLIQKCQYDDAERLLKEALEHNDKDFDVLYNLAYVYQATGQYDEALEKYKRAKEINTDQELNNEIEEIMNMIHQKHANEPLVSVCMPVFNDEENILKAVNSVLNQTYQNFEVIICDNNSEDKTYDVIQKIQDNRIRVYKNENNIGMLLNTNKCWELAKGKYILTLHGDDSYASTYIEKVVNVFANNKKVGIVHFIHEEFKKSYFENNSYFKAARYYSKIAGSQMIPPPTQTAFKKEALVQTDYYENEYWTAEARLMMKIADLGFDAYIEGQYLFERYNGPEKDSSQIEKQILRFEHLYNFYEEFKDDKKIKLKEIESLEKRVAESFFIIYQNKDKNLQINKAFIKYKELVKNNMELSNIIIDYILS